jgi:hypothetical protein
MHNNTGYFDTHALYILVAEIATAQNLLVTYFYEREYCTASGYPFEA